MNKTRIEWATHTWNPVTGCTKVSAGCKNCYAERMSKRLAGRCGYPPAPHNFDVTLHPDRLNDPLKWRKPRRVFTCSMGDLFHEDVPYDFILDVFNVIAQCPQHIFQILTKRPKRMKNVLERIRERRDDDITWTGVYPRVAFKALLQWPWSNIWLGVTAENQEQADKRIPILLQIPAAVRFVSVEPMLGPVDLTKWLTHRWVDCQDGARIKRAYLLEINWTVCGGESGPGARPMHPDWARSLRDQCKAAHVPYFLKQMEIDGKVVKMPELDGRVWDQIPDTKERK